MGTPRLLMWWPTDLNDSHVFHRFCLHALRDTLARSTGKPQFREAEVWFNHGAWAEWTRSLLALRTRHPHASQRARQCAIVSTAARPRAAIAMFV